MLLSACGQQRAKLCALNSIYCSFSFPVLRSGRKSLNEFGAVAPRLKRRQSHPRQSNMHATNKVISLQLKSGSQALFSCLLPSTQKASCTKSPNSSLRHRASYCNSDCPFFKVVHGSVQVINPDHSVSFVLIQKSAEC